MNNQIIYLIIGGAALYWLFGMGGLNQIQGMLGGFGGGSGGVITGGGASVSPQGGVNLGGLHVGLDGIRVPGLPAITANGGGGLFNANNNINSSQISTTGPGGTHSSRIVQIDGKTVVNESNLGRLMSI